MFPYLLKAKNTANITKASITNKYTQLKLLTIKLNPLFDTSLNMPGDINPNITTILVSTNDILNTILFFILFLLFYYLYF